MLTLPRVTLEDLYAMPGKAEIVNGEIVSLMPTGGLPGYAADEIFVSLRLYARQEQMGIAVGDNKGFSVNLPNRLSFSPDAAYYVGPPPSMRFYIGSPIFAVEVRSENDYGQTAEDAMAEKRRDYFLAGTEVVWDVDLQGDDVVCKWMTGNTAPTVYRRGETADAEPALPGWRLPVDHLFPR